MHPPAPQPGPRRLGTRVATAAAARNVPVLALIIAFIIVSSMVVVVEAAATASSQPLPPPPPQGVSLVSSPATLEDFRRLAQLSELAFCAASYPESYPAFAAGACNICDTGLLLVSSAGTPTANNTSSSSSLQVVSSPDRRFAGLVSVDPGREVILFGFRGAVDATNILSAAAYSLTPYSNPLQPSAAVEDGFLRTYLSMRDDFRTKIMAFMRSNPGYSLEAFGISYGCVLSQLAAVDISLLMIATHASTPSIQITGFGCPRVGNLAFARLFDHAPTSASSSSPSLGIRLRRFVHSRDIIVQYPPMTLGFHHAGVEYWLDARQGMVFRCEDASPSTNESPSCSDSIDPLLLSISSHMRYFDCTVETACSKRDGSHCGFLSF